MKDTPQAIEDKYREMLMACSPEERFCMACRMFGTAKALVEAGLVMECGQLERGELRRRMFLRFYGNDFPEAERDRIAEYLAAR